MQFLTTALVEKNKLSMYFITVSKITTEYVMSPGEYRSFVNEDDGNFRFPAPTLAT